MNFNPERYTPDVEEALLRWITIWEEMLTNAGANSYGFRFSGPEASVAFLADEIALRRLSNDRARKLHSRELKSLEKPLLAGCASLRAVLTSLSDHILKGRSEHVAVLIKTAQQQFANGVLLSALSHEIHEIVTSNMPSSTTGYDRLAWLSQQLIIGYYFRGLDESRIRSLPRKIFFHNERFVADTLYSDYPFIKTRHWQLSGYERSVGQHNEELLAEIAALTLDGRFAALSSEHETPRELTFIFPIKGLKGSVSLDLGRVKIYPPFVEKIGNLNEDDDSDLFDRKESDALNAAVMILGTNSDRDRRTAVRTIRAMLDVFVAYVPTRAPVTLVADRCKVFNADGSPAGIAYSSHGFNDDVLHQYIAPNLSEIHSHMTVRKAKAAADELALRPRGAAPEERISTAVGALRKANESDDLEDRLLNYWVSIECLLSTSSRDGILSQDAGSETAESLAYEVIPSMYVVSSLTQIGWELLGYLRVRHQYASLNNKSIFAAVSPELLSRAQIPFVPWATLAIEPFIYCLDELYEALRQDAIIAARIDYTRKIYQDNAAAKKELFRRKQRAFDDVVTIYQVRNRIVHSAYHDTAGMEYIVPAAQEYASRLIVTMLEGIKLTGSEILARSVANCERIFKRLEDNEHFDLLEQNF